MLTKIEILYDDDTTVLIDVPDATALDSAKKTGVLALMLWTPEGEKRIPLEYLEGNDNYFVSLNELSGVIKIYGFDDNKSGWWHYGNPLGTDGYTKPVIPPQEYFHSSPNAKSWNFTGSQVDGATWRSTQTKRLRMQRRQREV